MPALNDYVIRLDGQCDTERDKVSVTRLAALKN